MRLTKKKLPIFLLVILFSCTKEKNNIQLPTLEKGVLILNEGLFQQNNSTLSYYSTKTTKTTQEYFLKTNKRGLGDTGNDMIQYGNKIYIIVNVSGKVEVINSKTGKIIKQINFQKNGISKQPRSAIPYKNTIWISNFDGTIVSIDTSTLTQQSTISVGRNPEGLTTLENKLYVVNSGGLDNPNYDSTISVINLNNLQITNTYNVIINPSKIEASQNNLYCISRGNYTNILPVLQRINRQTGETVQNYTFLPIDMKKHNEKLYVLYKQTQNSIPKIGVFNLETGQEENPNFIKNTDITTHYGFEIDPQGNIYLKDAQEYVNTGKIYVYDNQGNYKYKIETGINPNSIISIK